MLTHNIKNVSAINVKQPITKRYNPIQGSGVVNHEVAKNMCIKRYYHTQDKEFTLPLEFVSSKNKKYIVVQYVGAIVKDTLVGDLMVHSNIVQQDGYCDCFIMLANRRQTKYRKYEFLGHERNYRIWFTDLYGNSIEPSAFIMSCLLIY